MTPNTITKAAFSRICGITKPGIQRAIDAGKIILEGKKVNLDHRLTAEYYFGKTGKKLKPTDHVKVKAVKAVKKKRPHQKPPPEPITAPIPPDNDPDPDADDGYRLPKGIKSFEDITIHNIHLIPIDLVKKWKELEATKKSRQDRETKRGKLIDRDIVKKVFAKIHTVDTNQWKTLEDRMVPLLCGLFGVNDGGKESFDARKMISKEVTKTLKHVKRLTDDFFATIDKAQN